MQRNTCGVGGDYVYQWPWWYNTFHGRWETVSEVLAEAVKLALKSLQRKKAWSQVANGDAA